MPLYQPGGGAAAAHATSHENGGSDEINATGLTGAGGGAPTAVGCRIKRTTDQTIASATLTAVAFNAADDDDTDAFHDPSSSNTRATVPSGKDGVYLIQGQVNWPRTQTSRFGAFFRVNGTATIGTLADQNDGDGVDSIAYSGATFYRLAAADYVELLVYQTTAGDLHVTAIDGGPHMAMYLVGT
jgi:hypothetical protein